MKTYVPNEPIAAIATALGPSALAVVRTSGAGCIDLVSRVFSRPKALLNSAGGTLIHGWMCRDEKKTEKIDEVMLGVYRAPKSFTGEDMVEIFCHGGTAPVSAVYRLLLQNGFKAAQAGEFTFRAFVNGKTDLTRAEAVREIIDSKTDESRSRACGRLAGSLYDELDNIKHLILSSLAALEADIEYPEDENAVAGVFNFEDLIFARDKLTVLISSWKSEKLYQDGVRMVLCGRTNAGKSSLFNALLKEDRAIVSDIHGTTRDWLESWISFAGIPVRLFDTAGLRRTDDIVEQAGVERTLDLTGEADLLLYLIDASEGGTEEDSLMIERLQKKRKPLVIVWNKTDKAPAGCQTGSTLQTAPAAKSFSRLAELTKKSHSLPCVYISAKTGNGLADLTETVKNLLLSAAGGTESGGAENALAGSERLQAGFGSLRQKKAADEALDSLNHAIAVPSLDLTLDAAVQDMEDALSFLGEITGEVGADDILENIFSRFCVGK